MFYKVFVTSLDLDLDFLLIGSRKPYVVIAGPQLFNSKHLVFKTQVNTHLTSLLQVFSAA